MAFSLYVRAILFLKTSHHMSGLMTYVLERLFTGGNSTGLRIGDADS